MKIDVMTDVLEANDRIATANGELFKKHRNLVLNLISSPGAGKTTMLAMLAALLTPTDGKVLIDQELSVTELAKRTGYTRQYLSALINGRFDSPRAKKMVAFTLGKN